MVFVFFILINEIKGVISYWNRYIKKYKSCQRSASLNIHAFFISNTFRSNARLKLAKKQVKAKQHPEAKLLLFENYLLSSFTLYHPELIADIPKNVQKASTSA